MAQDGPNMAPDSPKMAFKINKNRRENQYFCDAPDNKVLSKKGLEKEGAPGHAQCVPGGALLEGVHFGTLVWGVITTNAA